MKKKFTFLIAALMLLFFMTPSMVGWGQSTYTKVTGTPSDWSGTYVIVADKANKIFTGQSGSSNYGGHTDVTIVDGSVTGNFSDYEVLVEQSGNYYSIKHIQSGKYLGFTGSSNALMFSINSPDVNNLNTYRWRFYNNSDVLGIFNASSVGRILKYNSQSPRFACYTGTNAQQKEAYLYKKQSAPSCIITPDPNDPNPSDFGGVHVGQSATKTFTVATSDLTSDLTIEVLDNTNFSLDKTTIEYTASSTDITVTFTPTVVSTWEDGLYLSGDDFEEYISFEFTAEGLCNNPDTPLAYTTPVNLTLSGASVQTTLIPTTDTGNGGSIMYAFVGDYGSDATINSATGAFQATAIGQYVVRATQDLASTTCGGEFDITINVTGTGPVCTIDPTTYDFGTVLTGSDYTQNFTVTTANLTGDLTVVIDNTDKGFSILSPSPATIEQNATSTPVTVKYNPTTASSEVTATLTISGGGITTQTATVKGTPSAGYTITFNAGTGTCTTPSVTNLPGYEFTLPTADDVTAPEGWDFAGWCETNVSPATTEEPTLLTGSYTISGDASLYAVYSKTEVSGGTQEFAINKIAKANGWTDGSNHKTIEILPITLTATGGSSINGNFYKSDSTWRVYSSGSPAGGVLVTTSLGAVTAVSSNPNKTFTISDGSASFTASSTTAFKSISVTYYNSTTTYHTSPTAKVATPTIEIAGVGTGAANTYYEKATVTLACETEGATIHYTTNGDEPTSSSDTYSVPFDVTDDATIKAIAVKTDYTNSNVTSAQTINIVHRNATFTAGVYSTLNTSATFNEWYDYSVTGNDEKWDWNTTYLCAKMYGNSNVNEDWLISPKMQVVNGKLAISFECAARYGSENQYKAYYSTNYPGYGDPSTYTWTEADVTLPYNNDNYDFSTKEVSVAGSFTHVYFAFKYVSTKTESGTLEVKNFTAKQCYPVTYNKNGGGDGTMAEDPNSPYAVGATVTVLDCDFTAPEEPENMEFVCWSTQADGNGDKYYPGTDNNTFTMGTSAVELFVIWAQACTTDPVMAETTNNNEYVNDGGAKSWTINLGSSITSVGTGGCEISEYGFVYSMVNNPPTTSDTKITLDIPGGGVSAGDIEAAITESAESTTYYVRSYAINNHGIGYGPLSTITTNAFPKYQIDYYINSTTKSYSKEIYQGDAITATELPDVSGSAPDGFTFMGWKSSVIDGVQNDPPTYVAVDDVLEANSSFYAVFAIAGTGEAEQNLEMTATNFTELTGSYGTYTHEYTDVATIEVYSCKQSYAFQVNKSKNVYFKNTTPMPGYITKFVIDWSDGTDKNTITMYANGNSVASTSSTNVGEPDAGTPQTITIENASTNNYKYFYLYPETVSGGCKISSFKIYYMGTGTIYSNFCTSVESISGNENIDEETGRLTDDVIVTEGVFYVDEIITVPNGTKLEIKGTGALISPVAANLIIEEGGQLIVPTGTEVAATFIKSVPENTSKDVAVTGWTLISSPTNNGVDAGNPYENFGDVTNLEDGDGYLLYKYDEKERYWRSSQTTGHEYDKLYVAQGYLYGNNSGTAIKFTGNVNSAASYSIDLSYNAKDSDNLAGFNLIGNPFSHDIYKGVGGAINDSKLADGFYIIENGEAWTAKLGYDTPIKPGQGILVKATEEFKLTINNTTANATADKANHDNIMFKVENSECSDVAYALFDKGYGLNKISHRGDMVPMLYIPQNGENYAIAMMDDNTKTFNLGFEAKTTAKYTLTYKAKGEFNYLHVIDRMTGEDIDMLLEGEYSFVGSPRDNANRFIVRLGYLPNYDDNGEDTFAYQNGNDIVVSGEGEFQIFDVMGRKVASITINGVETVNIPTQGVYIMKLNEKTQKIVVR